MSKIISPYPNFPRILFLLLLCISFHGKSQIENDEQNILIKLREEWGNPPAISSWTSSNINHCNWTGIVCVKGSVTGIDLSGNHLTGTIPDHLGKLQSLKKLDLSDNQLSGEIPENLCVGGVLKEINVGSNNLSGEVPITLRNCNSLKNLNLGNNSFSGEFPPGIFSSGNISRLIISDNMFTGELPDKLAPNLIELEISSNRFSGEIPSYNNKLTVIKASNNLFSGQIPSNFSQLEILYLDNNRLSGKLPLKIITPYKLSYLNLRGNQLSGKIPPGIGLLHLLVELDLSENQFSGELPPQFGQYLIFAFINLSSNRLTGKIPPELEKQINARSFLNNPGLCSDNPILNLTGCNLRKRILILAVVVSLIVVIFSLFVIRCCRRKKLGRIPPATWELTSFHRLDFTESDILSSLSENNLIGSGGSGKVYRIPINGSGESIAVKKIWNNRKLDRKLEKQFEAEVQILGTIRHSNIVKLFCCISSENSKLLVYEYMENQSLDQWIHRKSRETSGDSASVHHVVLDWPKRLEIAVGAAQGLCYMHHDCSPAIIHRDVKSSNILLDSEFKAKIADFGLAKMLMKRGEANTMSTVAGSFGYFAPEYAYTTKVDEKIDVYSFGVVLLELVTGRKACDGDEHTSLAEWAWRHFLDGKAIVDIVDEDIKEPSCYLNEISIVLKLGLICTGTLPSTRPSLKEVLQILLRCDSL